MLKRAWRCLFSTSNTPAGPDLRGTLRLPVRRHDVKKDIPMLTV